jgi:hypothetical protein
VTLINTNGMAFIGPGSEWFWAAVSGLVLAITFLAIFRQLQLQRDAAAIQQLEDIEHEWSSERLARAKLALLLAIQGGAGADDLPQRATAEIGFFWQRLGYLVRSGNLDRRLVYEHLGPQVPVWATWIRPGKREEGRDWPDFAWLAEAVAEMDKNRGLPGTGRDEAADQVPGMIAFFREAIDLFEELRTVRVRVVSMPASVTGQLAPPLETPPLAPPEPARRAARGRPARSARDIRER